LLLDRHPDAIEYDLLRHGFRIEDLGTAACSWRDLQLILRFGENTAVAREIAGQDAAWTLTNQLLAGLIDAVNVGNWQRQRKKGAPRPKPIPRPGVREETKRYGSKPIPISAFQSWWDSKN
jgi:hypothetical protein